MISTTTGCKKCGTTLIIGTSVVPYCPNCNKAYHALEVRYAETGEGATIEEVLAAMTEDAQLSASLTEDSQIAFALSEEGAA